MLGKILKEGKVQTNKKRLHQVPAERKDDAYAG